MADLGALDILLLVVAAFVAGAVNAVAGGGSLISFPALLAVGYSGVTANVTNMVALLPGYIGGTTAYRRELTGQRARAKRLGVTAAIGTGIGTAILLLAPGSAFDAVVPVLILLACALLAAQPWLARAVARREIGHHGLHACILVGAIYGGYFGAGLGIMLLAILGAFIDEDIQRLNALKGLLSLVIAIASAIVVAVFGPVAWVAGALMASTSVVGGWLGVGVARRLPSGVLRWGIVGYGVVVGLILAVRQIT